MQLVAKQQRKPAERKQFAQEVLALMKQALEADAFVVAGQMAQLALDEGTKLHDKETVVPARDGAKQAEQAAKAYEPVAVALERLKTSPDDADANLTVGRYQCFVKGEWDKGFRLLAKGSDASLKAVAVAEIRGPGQSRERNAESGQAVASAPNSNPQDSRPEAQDPLLLGDAWWNLAQESEGRAHDSMLLRAGYWYQQAVSEIGTDAQRIKVELRLQDIAKLGRAIPTPPLKSTFTNSIGMKFVLIPAGEFMMGTTQDEISQTLKQVRADAVVHRQMPSEAPSHRVRIRRPFYMGMYEVTQGEYERVMGANPSSFSAKGKGSEKVAAQDTSAQPVESLSWESATLFCQKLSALPREKAATRVYRLPTEAEWEYAARAGSTAKWCFGDNAATINEYAWLSAASGGRTHQVGQKKPNAWGLYDTVGNVCEWTMDWYGQEYYGQSTTADPTGPATGRFRSLRGGSWSSSPLRSRSAFRFCSPPTSVSDEVGLRVLCEIAEKPTVGSVRLPSLTGTVSTKPKSSSVENPVEPAAKSKSHKTDTPAKNQLTNSIGMKFVFIPAGEFMMGSPPEEIAGATQEATQKNDKWALARVSSEAPKHRVRLSRAFYLGAYEVTQAEYQQVMGSNPCSFSAQGKDAARVAGQDTRRIRWRTFHGETPRSSVGSCRLCPRKSPHNGCIACQPKRSGNMRAARAA